MSKQVSRFLLAWVLATAVSPLLADAGSFPLENRGDTTYDPNTGLEWLDLSLTAGQSYSAVLKGWHGYTGAEGFRFATRTEITQLFADAGAATIGFPSDAPNAADLQAAALALSLLGTTLAQTDESRSWMFYDPSTEPTLPTPAHISTAVFGMGVVRAGYPEEGFFLVPGLFPFQDYSSPEMGSALVRVIPEPSTTLMMAVCLGWCCLRRSPPRTCLGGKPALQQS